MRKNIIAFLQRSGGRINPKDIYARCIENRSSLWIIFETDTLNIIGCGITQLHDYQVVCVC